MCVLPINYAWHKQLLLINHANLRVLCNCSLELSSCTNVMIRDVLLNRGFSSDLWTVPEACTSFLQPSFDDIRTTVMELYSETWRLRPLIEDYGSICHKAWLRRTAKFFAVLPAYAYEYAYYPAYGGVRLVYGPYASSSRTPAYVRRVRLAYVR